MRNLLIGKVLTLSPSILQDRSVAFLNSSDWDTRSGRILTDGAIYDLDHFATSGEWGLWSQTENDLATVTIDLGVATECSVFRAYGAHNFGVNTARPKAIKFESSDNGSSWATVDNLTGLTSPGTGSGTRGWIYEADLTAAGSHRYWKLTLTHKSQFISLTEVELLDLGDPYVSLLKLALGNMSDPGVNFDHVLRVRARKIEETQAGILRARLVQSPDTVIEEFEIEL